MVVCAGVSAPPPPSPSELGWTGSLPHPMEWTAAADSELLKAQAKEVRAPLSDHFAPAKSLQATVYLKMLSTFCERAASQPANHLACPHQVETTALAQPHLSPMRSTLQRWLLTHSGHLVLPPEILIRDFCLVLCCVVVCSHLQVGVAARRESLGETLAGLQEMLMYGLKGMAAYTHHAEALGATSDEAYSYINSALHFLAQPAAKDAGECCWECRCNCIILCQLGLGSVCTGLAKCMKLWKCVNWVGEVLQRWCEDC